MGVGCFGSNGRGGELGSCCFAENESSACAEGDDRRGVYAYAGIGGVDGGVEACGHVCVALAEDILGEEVE